MRAQDWTEYGKREHSRPEIHRGSEGRGEHRPQRRSAPEAHGEAEKHGALAVPVDDRVDSVADLEAIALRQRVMLSIQQVQIRITPQD